MLKKLFYNKYIYLTLCDTELKFKLISFKLFHLLNVLFE